MSLPAAITSHAITSISTINPFDTFLHMFNTNPYFIGIMMLILNLGGRFISLEVTKKQEQFLQRPWVRRLLIFTVLFVATRNIWVAFWATVTVILFLGYLFNENSALCIFGDGGYNGSKCSDSNQTNDGMTPEEKEILQRLTSKSLRYQTNNTTNTKNPEQVNLEKSTTSDNKNNDENVLFSDIYKANVTLLRTTT